MRFEILSILALASMTMAQRPAACVPSVTRVCLDRCTNNGGISSLECTVGPGVSDTSSECCCDNGSACFSVSD